jgi:phosphatidylcholine synthase
VIRPILAWLVHLYTALGSVLGFLIVREAIEGRYRAAFMLMLVATVVDATDGWLARTLRVKELLPAFNGGRLDDIVDYLTFVFAPAVVLERADVVTGPLGTSALFAMLLSSAYGFSRENAKTADHFFTGFPSYWNIVAFYLYVLRLSPQSNAVVILVLAVLVFVPVAYVYPSRTPQLRLFTVSLGIVWGLGLVWLLFQTPNVPVGWLWLSLLYPLYYFVLSLVLHRRRRR